MRAVSKLAIGAGVVASTLALTVGAAIADPPSGTTPKATDIVSAGSDTIQLVEDQLSTDYNATKRSKDFYSYDAVPVNTNITPKAGCAAIARPNGSSAGIAALKASGKSGSNYCIDMARSSRAPSAGDGSNGALAFVAFAQDGVTWSAHTTTNAPASLTPTQLQAIYSCNAAILGNGQSGPVSWNEVGGKTTAKVAPIIPQSSSGTRAFFLSKIGVTTLGSCVKPTNDSVEENEGTNAIFNSNKVNEVFPYSVAVYLAQSVHNHDAGKQGDLVLKSINGTKPTTGSGSSTQLNPAFPFSRLVYNVVRDSGASTHVPTYLQPLIGKGNDSGFFCTNGKALTDIRSYGFRTIGSNCGSVTVAPNGS